MEYNGYKSREDYLYILAEEYSIDFHIVQSLSDILGESEDFDGLLALLEDY